MKKYNFLIVDDIFMNRLLLKEIISELCNSYKEAKNGKEAIDIIQEENIDIILMDIEMPVMNGVETTKYIRTQMPYPKNKLPIIALTAHNPDDFFDDYSNAGFDKLLTKPYSFKKILDTISSFGL
jgi:CheY-like chemotaxis protein